MSPLSEIRYVAQRELRKNVRSAKGIVLLVLSLMGGTAVTLLIVFLKRLQDEKLGKMDPEEIRQMRELALTKAFGDETTGKVLSHSPEILLMVLVITVWLTPLLISLLGFDTVSSDLQHKAVRYWTMRTRRVSYLLGKWLGLWASISLITFIMHFAIWVVCIARGEAPVGSALGWGLRLWPITLPISAAWCAIATLISSLFKTPILSLLAIFGVFFALFLTWMIGKGFDVTALQYVYPNFYDSLLLNQRIDRFAIGLSACLGMTALYLGAGSFFFTKRDI